MGAGYRMLGACPAHGRREDWRARRRPSYSTDATVAMVVVGAVLGLGLALPAVAHARPARQLGAAYRAYDANDLAGAQRLLASSTPASERSRQPRLRAVAARHGRAAHAASPATARTAFEQLGKLGGSRFAREVPWRLADVAWERGDRAAAAKAYATLIAADGAGAVGDVGTAKFRIAETSTGKAAVAAYRARRARAPGPSARRPRRGQAASSSARRRSTTAERHRAREAAHRRAPVGRGRRRAVAAARRQLSTELARQRDYWLGTTLFKMRRRYADAGELLLGVYKDMGGVGRRGDVPRRARAVARRSGRRGDRLVPQGRRRVPAAPRGPQRRSSSRAGSSSTAASTARRSRRSRRRSRSIRSRSGSTTRCGSSACRTTSSASGTRREARLDGARQATAARSRAARATYWLARIDEKLGRQGRRDRRLHARLSSATRSRGTRCSRAPGCGRSASSSAPFGVDDAEAARRQARGRGRRGARQGRADPARRRADRGRARHRRRRRARARRARVPQAPRSRRRVRDAARSLPQGRQLQPAVDARGQLPRRRARRPARGRRPAVVGERLSARLPRADREAPGARQEPRRATSTRSCARRAASIRTSCRTPTRRACCR